MYLFTSFFFHGTFGSLSHRFCDWSKLTAVALTPWRAAARSKSKVLISQPWAAPFRWIFWPCNRSYRAHTSGILQKHTSCTEGSPALLWCHFMGERSCILAWLWPCLPHCPGYVTLSLCTLLGLLCLGALLPAVQGVVRNKVEFVILFHIPWLKLHNKSLMLC